MEELLGSFEINLSEKNDLTKNQIPSGEMTLKFTITREISTGIICVKFEYEWMVLPIFRYEDIIAVGWDGGAFTIQDSSFSKTDYYYCRVSVEEYATYVYSNELNPMVIAQNGISWGAKLKDSSFTTVLRLYGKGEFKLIPTTTTRKNITLYANYIHKKPLCNVSISFSGSGAVGSIGISGVEYDSIGSSKTLYWE